MRKRFLTALGWSTEQAVVFLVFFFLFVIILPCAIVIGGLTDWILLLTGIVLLFYTIETHGVRLEMVRQNELSVRPLVIAQVEERTVQRIAPTPEVYMCLQNIGRGPALFVQVNDVPCGGGPEGRYVAKFEKVDFIEAGKVEVVEVGLYVDDGEQITRSQLRFVPSLNPRGNGAWHA